MFMIYKMNPFNNDIEERKNSNGLANMNKDDYHPIKNAILHGFTTDLIYCGLIALESFFNRNNF